MLGRLFVPRKHGISAEYIGVAGVGASTPLSGFVAPVRRKSGGINTGIAIHNTESTSVTLNLTLRNSQGEEVANGTKTIADFPAAVGSSPC